MSRDTLPSVLDRLLDDGNNGTMLFDLPRFKRALARDLEALLNTRRLHDALTHYPLAADSMLQFGIPDLSGVSLLNPDDRHRLQEQLRVAICTHEPRLSRVNVQLEAPRETGRHLRFRVDAVLTMYPHKPSVSFDAMLQLSSNVYRIQD